MYICTYEEANEGMNRWMNLEWSKVFFLHPNALRGSRARRFFGFSAAAPHCLPLSADQRRARASCSGDIHRPYPYVSTFNKSNVCSVELILFPAVGIPFDGEIAGSGLERLVSEERAHRDVVGGVCVREWERRLRMIT